MRELFRRCVRGRSLRELLLLGIGSFFAIRELLDPATDWPNFAVYLGATLAFAFRFFPARAIGVGTSLSALAQRWSELLIHGRHVSDFDWTAYAPFAALALLCSSDLVAKFDDAPTGIRWLPNLWGAIPRRDARLLRWCCYALAIVAALLFKSLQNNSMWGDPHYFAPQALTVGFYLAIALLAFGRAPALLAIPPLCAIFVVATWSEIPGSVASLSHGDSLGRPEYLLPAIGFAIVAGLLALPFACKLLRATLRANSIR
jgi:hypothetical protein